MSIKATAEDIYAAQRDELLTLLSRLSSSNEPLTVHGNALLTPDEMSIIIVKIKNKHHFSRKERAGLIEAGFDVDHLFPKQ